MMRQHDVQIVSFGRGAVGVLLRAVGVSLLVVSAAQAQLAPRAIDLGGKATPEGKALTTTEQTQFTYERALVENKIEPTPEGLRDYLLSLRPSEETRRTLEKLITQLGNEEFAEREAAMTQLRQRSAVAMETLKAATTHDDPEVRWRAKKLLETANTEGNSTFFAVFKTIETREFKGLAAPILGTLPLITKEHVRFAARRALVATATAEDLPLLRKELQNAEPQVRIAVLGAIAAVNDKNAADDALTLAGDKEDIVRMAVARILAKQGRRETLAILVSLLDSREVDIRGEAGRTLRVVTSLEFGYIAYDKDEVRNAARDKWKHWLATDGATAKLSPLVKDVPLELGRLLICSYATSTVFEYDADAKDAGKPRWQVQMGQQPWALQGLPNGNRLVAYYGGMKVVEFGPENDAKKPLWESEKLPGGPMGIHRLDNGNTVVACTDAEMIVELDAQGKILKKWTITGRPVDVQRLESGHTLVTLQNGQRVVEIDDDGKERWSTKVALSNPFSAQRLENGNTLITVLSGRRVVEVSPDGAREEWSIGDLTNPYHAKRLSNGNTLVVDQNGVYEYETSQKKVVWKLQVPHISRASRF